MGKAASFAWAVPDERALNIIAQYGPVVEVGAGLGYWARCLRERGVDVEAYDILVSPVQSEENDNTVEQSKEDQNSKVLDNAANDDTGEELQSAWTKVEEGGPEMLEKVDSSRALFLCYPDDFEQSEESMAEACLTNFTGDTVIHVGEWLGSSACRPNPWGRSSGEDFQLRLASTFHKVLQVPLPCWSAGADSLSVWKRTTTCIYEGEMFADIPPSERLNLTMVCPSTEHLAKFPIQPSAQVDKAGDSKNKKRKDEGEKSACDKKQRKD